MKQQLSLLLLLSLSASAALPSFLTDEARAGLLARIQTLDPSLQGIVFDADGDGKVSIEEQDLGRHPLTQLISPAAVEKGTDIPWSPDLFSEWLMYCLVPADLPEGPVEKFPARGLRESQETIRPEGASAPVRTADGLVFGPGAFLSAPRERDARWFYRWGALLFKLDAPDTSAPARETVLLDVNSGRGPSRSSPRVAYSQETGLSVQFVGLGNGVDTRRAVTKTAVADGKTWNILVFGMRQGNLFASLNGLPFGPESPQPGRFSTPQMNEKDVSTYIGSKDGAGWTLGALLLGQTEPSEATVRKLEGWAAHALGAEVSLPGGHPYKVSAPVLDLEDLPHRYTHDSAVWDKWLEGIKDKTFTRANAGGPRVVPEGFRRVFFDDFDLFRVSDSTSGTGNLWMAPGWNTAVGANAQLMAPRRDPDVYPHDGAKGVQRLSLVKKNDRFFSSGIVSVNDLGQGYSWTGPKVFRTRVMFPKKDPKKIPGGLFPAFWSYGTEFLYWRTSNRIECDFFELDGLGPAYYNGLSTHVHYPHVKSSFVANTNSYQRGKGYGGVLDEEKAKIPGGFTIWDGVYHTWEFVFDTETTFVNITVPDPERPGEDRWVEVFRIPTSPTYLERLYLLYDYALKAKQGTPGDREDFFIDWVEVYQKAEQVDRVPEIFAARPEIVGKAEVGGKLVCRASAPGITDFRYYWFVDDQPITYGASEEFIVGPKYAGRVIRCMVKAVGARDMPEVWTAAVRVPADEELLSGKMLK